MRVSNRDGFRVNGREIHMWGIDAPELVQERVDRAGGGIFDAESSQNAPSVKFWGIPSSKRTDQWSRCPLLVSRYGTSSAVRHCRHGRKMGDPPQIARPSQWRSFRITLKLTLKTYSNEAEIGI